MVGGVLEKEIETRQIAATELEALYLEIVRADEIRPG
jgi:hypothetical protein